MLKSFFTVFFLSAALFLDLSADENSTWTVQMIEEDGWPLYQSSNGYISFVVRIPGEPVASEDHGNLNLMTTPFVDSLQAIIYSASCEIFENKLDATEIYSQAIRPRRTYPFVIDHSVSNNEMGVVIDLLIALENSVMKDVRKIITDHEIYTFTTLYFVGTMTNHEYFINSFQILHD